ncbi:ankyrin repeat domain-containing protein [Wolbachia endosymbiont of Pentidionis agamae]|uniref:ankyrin repeat domain-containing protein n=1 Tax=Wolbachia endosymbiont of Pentidionis agamae TaxID=3110435 RepID=UPI002FD6BE27
MREIDKQLFKAIKDIANPYSLKVDIIKVLSDLIKEGANVNAVDHDRKTLLHCAVSKMPYPMLENRTEDYSAVASLNEKILKIVKFLLEKEVDVNAVDNYGYTPLHHAAEKGLTEIAKLLLENEADVSAIDKDGETPLHWAAKNGRVDAIELLINKELMLMQKIIMDGLLYMLQKIQKEKNYLRSILQD